MHKSKVVNTKRERRSSNNKNSNNNNISKQPSSSQTQPIVTLGALVTGLTSTPPNMSDEINQTDTLIIKPTTIEINNQPNGNHSPSKSLHVKIGNENENGHEIVDEQNSISSPSHIDHGVDSGLSSEITNTEIEKTIVDDELSSTSGISSTLIQMNESNSSNGIIIPEEKRVTDRVKVFESVVNNNIKNGNNKKKSSSSTSSSFSIGDQKQISPTELFDTQSINEIKSSKNKSKKSSLKKQIQNLLKIDKPSIQDEFNSIDEQQINGKKNKKDHKQNEENSSSSTISKLINTFQPNDIEQTITLPPLNTFPIQTENVSCL